MAMSGVVLVKLMWPLRALADLLVGVVDFVREMHLDHNGRPNSGLVYRSIAMLAFLSLLGAYVHQNGVGFDVLGTLLGIIFGERVIYTWQRGQDRGKGGRCPSPARRLLPIDNGAADDWQMEDDCEGVDPDAPLGLIPGSPEEMRTRSVPIDDSPLAAYPGRSLPTLPDPMGGE